MRLHNMFLGIHVFPFTTEEVKEEAREKTSSHTEIDTTRQQDWFHLCILGVSWWWAKKKKGHHLLNILSCILFPFRSPHHRVHSMGEERARLTPLLIHHSWLIMIVVSCFFWFLFFLLVSSLLSSRSCQSHWSIFHSIIFLFLASLLLLTREGWAALGSGGV